MEKIRLMFQNTQAHLRSRQEIILCLGLAWLHLELAHYFTLYVLSNSCSTRINAQVYKTILSRNLQKKASKLIKRHFVMQQDNDPKHAANTTKDFIRGKKWKDLDWPT